MKVLIAIAVLFVALLEELKTTEAYPFVGYHAAPGIEASSLGHGYGAHGGKSAGYGAYGHGGHGEHSHFGDKGYGTHGFINAGGIGAHGAHGGYGTQFGKYRNVGVYAQDKGTGFEKAYNYDKKAGHHGITADFGGHHGGHGVHSKKAHHNLGTYGLGGHAKYGAHDKYGGQIHGVHAHDNLGFKKHGGEHAQMYHVLPAYGYHAGPGFY